MPKKIPILWQGGAENAQNFGAKLKTKKTKKIIINQNALNVL